LTPCWTLNLFLDDLFQVDGFVELVSLSTWIADPAFRVQVFRYLRTVSAADIFHSTHKDLHNPLAVYSKKHAPELLKLHCRQRQRSPLAGRFLLQLRYSCGSGSQASFEQNSHCHPVEESMAPPEKRNVDVVAALCNLDAPELLGYEILDSEVTIHHKAEGRELT